MNPDDYIREFFATIKTYLGEAEIKSSGRHAKYKNSSITASWTDELWNVEMHDELPLAWAALERDPGGRDAAPARR